MNPGVSRHSKRKSVLQERRAAEELGGRVQPGSGAPEFYKSDVRVAGEVRVECKTTSKRAFVLKLKELDKIRDEALRGGLEVPVLQVEFRASNSGRRFAVLDYAWFYQMESRCNPVRHLLVTPVNVLSQSVPLNLDGLIRLQAAASEAKYHWVLKVVFGGTRMFAVINWEDFLAMHATSKEKE